jgi:hypothetical protein
MADTLEAVALRLRDFIQAAQENAVGRIPGRIPMGGMRTQPRRPNDRPKAPILETCEECLGELTPDELVKLDSMIEKMSSVLGSPPGAIIPS